MLVSSRIKVGLTLAALVCALVVVPGCGCSDDSILTFPTPDVLPAAGQVGMELHRTPARGSGPLKIDVMFLLDDGLSMTGRDSPGPGQPAPGAILGDPAGRIKTDVAQAVAANVEDELLAKLLADGVIASPEEADLAFGIDLEASNGEPSWTLPIPARYIVDSSGVVRYARVHPDYTTRPEPTETLEALARL